MIGLGRIPSGQTEDRDMPKSFCGVVGDCKGGLSVGALVLRRRAQSIKDFFLLVCFCSDSLLSCTGAWSLGFRTN